MYERMLNEFDSVLSSSNEGAVRQLIVYHQWE